MVGPDFSVQRSLILVLRWIIPIAILLAFIVSGHLGAAVRALGDVSLWWSAILLLFGIALPISHAWRWRFLMRRVNEEISLSGSVQVTALASLLNYAAPGFLGAPAKAIFARDSYRIPISRSLPTLAFEQMLDAVLLALGGLIAVLVVVPAIFHSVPGSIAIASERAIPVIAFLVSSAVVAGLSWLIVRRFFPGFPDALLSATMALMRSREYLRPIVALTVTRWVLDMAAIGVASIAVGLRLSLFEILLIGNLALLAGVLAPAPGGLGVRELVMASLAGVIGVSIPAILTLAVLHRAALAVGLPIVLGCARIQEWREG